MICTLLCWSENIKYVIVKTIKKYLNTYASIWYLNTIQILNFVEYLAKYLHTKHNTEHWTIWLAGVTVRTSVEF